MTHKNKSEMLLWLSRQSTSLVRTRSPVRIWLAAPRKVQCLSRFLVSTLDFLFSEYRFFKAFLKGSGSQKVVRFSGGHRHRAV